MHAKESFIVCLFKGKTNMQLANKRFKGKTYIALITLAKSRNLRVNACKKREYIGQSRPSYIYCLSRAIKSKSKGSYKKGDNKYKAKCKGNFVYN